MHYITVLCTVIILLRSCMVSRAFQILHNIINREVVFLCGAWLSVTRLDEGTRHVPVWQYVQPKGHSVLPSSGLRNARIQQHSHHRCQAWQLLQMAVAETMGLVWPAADGISQWPNCPAGTRSPRENCSSNYCTIAWKNELWEANCFAHHNQIAGHLLDGTALKLLLP